MKKRVYNIKFVVVFLGGFLFSTQFSFAQSPVVKTTVDKNRILIGQQIHYTVNASMPDNTYRLNWFTVPDSFGNFVPVVKEKIDSTYSNGNLNFSQQITITSFDSGRQVIPPLSLNFSTLDGDSSFNVDTDSIPVEVGYAPADSVLPFHDIKGIIEVKKELSWWLWAAIAAGIAMLVAAIIYWMRRKKKPVDAGLFDAKLPPYEEAMQLLDQLHNEKLPEKNEFREYHARLSDIFKRFLSRITDTNEMHLTTDELLVRLTELELPKEKIGIFAHCLRTGNAVKFARYIPPAYENEKSLEEIREMITSINHIKTKKPEDGI